MTAGSCLESGRPSAAEQRTVHITNSAARHQYHGIMDDLIGQYMEMTEHAGTPLFIDPVSHTMMYHGPIATCCGAVGLDEQTGDMLEWHPLVRPLYTAEPQLLTASTLRTRGAWVWFREVVAMGIRWPRSVNVQEGYWYFDQRAFASRPYLWQYMAQQHQLFAHFLARANGVPSRFDLHPALSSATGAEQLKEPCEFIFVATRGGGARSMINGAELVTALRARLKGRTDLAVLDAGDFTSDLLSNMRLAQSLRMLITPHGQGTTNYLFMRPGAVVLEVDPYRSERFAWFGAAIAQVTALHFFATAAPTQPDGSFKNHEMDNGDMNARVLVDVPYVVDLAEEWLRKEEIFRPAYVAHALDVLRSRSHPHIDWPPDDQQPWEPDAKFT